MFDAPMRSVPDESQHFHPAILLMTPVPQRTNERILSKLGHQLPIKAFRRQSAISVRVPRPLNFTYSKAGTQNLNLTPTRRSIADYFLL